MNISTVPFNKLYLHSTLVTCFPGLIPELIITLKSALLKSETLHCFLLFTVSAKAVFSPRPQTLEFFSLILDSAQAPGSILQPLPTVTSLSFFDPLVRMQTHPPPNPSPLLYSLASHGKGSQRTKFSPVNVSERDVCRCHLFKKKFPWVVTCFKLVHIWKYVPFAVYKRGNMIEYLKNHSFFAFKL